MRAEAKARNTVAGVTAPPSRRRGSQLPALQATVLPIVRGDTTLLCYRRESAAIFSSALSARENPQWAAAIYVAEKDALIRSWTIHYATGRHRHSAD